MKRVFEIEYPDNHGSEWLNEDNMQLIFNDYCKGAGVVARDITPKDFKPGDILTPHYSEKAWRFEPMSSEKNPYEDIDINNMVAILEECVVNGQTGKDALYAWFSGEQEVIDTVIQDNKR